MKDPQPSKKFKIFLHTLSALIPFIILGVAFALNNVYPFGDRQILVTDYWHQYFPFLSDHWHRLRNGNSFLWSWSSGGGHDYLAHFAYYLSSPFNFLIALFPHEYLREVLMVFLMIKIGLSGLFMSFFLSATLKKHDILLPAFSSFYALCAFTLGYYWNLMWFDTIALLPLVMLGVYSLVREGKYRLYIGSLALAILSNFYIGMFVCIFVAIMFFVQSYVAKLSWRVFFKRMFTIGIASIIALGISAVILMASLDALRNSYRAESAFPDFRFIDSFPSVLGNFIAFTPPTSLTGLPNLYSGLLSVILIPVFLLSKKISFREKIAYLALLIFMILSVNINTLDFIWNGFTVTNMLPFRFSFIASFIVVVIAYKAISLIDEFDIADLMGMFAAASFFHVMALLGAQENTYILHSAILGVVYLVLFALIIITKKSHLFKYIIFLVVVGEIAFTAYNGVTSVRTTSRHDFPANYQEVQTLLNQRHTSSTNFVRTELSRDHTLNSPPLFGYDGISFFSSFANVSATHFMEGIGLPGWPRGNRFTYAATSPLTNAFLNVRYMIGRGEHPMGDGGLWTRVATEGDNHLFRNNFHLPFGFMVNEEILNYQGNITNPFLAQNDLFRLATGIAGPDEHLFRLIDIIHVGHRNYFVERLDFGTYSFRLDEGEEDGMFRFNYQMPVDGPLYAFFNFPDTNRVRVVYEDGQTLQHIETRRSYIFSAGTFQEGRIVSFEADSEVATGSGWIFVAAIDLELFNRGFEILSSETLNLTYFSDTLFRGEISVSESRILYTSLPYAGNWRVFVNGVPREIVSIGGAMAGVRLSPGNHVVEFRYHNTTINLGIAISIISLVVYAIMLGLSHQKIDALGTLLDRLFGADENEKDLNTITFDGTTI